MTLSSVRFGFDNRRDFLGPVDITIRRGECWAIVGPNGAGKSTLLRLMAGLLKPTAGNVLGSDDRTAITPRERAKWLALVPQHPVSDLALTVREVVLMGRFPHRSLGLFESAKDHQLTDQAMRLTQTHAFADRTIATLSGGEAQRVHLAAALAQAPSLLLLDEPTASMDLRHQLAIFQLVRERATRIGTVIVTHDVNLAARYCTHVLLLGDGRVVAKGAPADVITPAVLEPVYGVELALATTRGGTTDQWVVPAGALEGGGACVG